MTGTISDWAQVSAKRILAPMVLVRELEILRPIVRTDGTVVCSRNHVRGEYVGPVTVDGTSAVAVKFVRKDEKTGLSLLTPLVVVHDSALRAILYQPREHLDGMHELSVRWLAAHLEWPPMDYRKPTQKEKPRMMREILQEFADRMPE